MAIYADLEDMPFVEWLAGCVPVDITDGIVNNILFEREIESDATLEETTLKQRELAKADLYMWCSLMPSISSTVKDSDGGWSHSEGGGQLTIADKRRFHRLARAIYRKYGINTGGGSVNINNMGMKVFPTR